MAATVALVVVALGVIVGAFALFAGGGSTSTGADQPITGSMRGANSVVRLDPDTGEVAQPVGGISASSRLSTIALAVGEGGVWVGSAPNLYHVDPVTETIRKTIPLPPREGNYSVPAVAFRTVWVVNGVKLERVNPATDKRLRPISLLSPRQPIPQSGGRPYIVAGETRVWLAGDPAGLIEIDPERLRVVRRIEVPSDSGLAVGDGAVWVIDDLSGQLTRIDPATGNPTDSNTLPGSLDDVAAGGGHVWVLDKGAGTIAVIDPSTLEPTQTIRVGSDARDLEFGDDALWVAEGEEASVTRIDLPTYRQTEFPVGGPATLVAVGSEGVWALVQS